MLLIAADSPLEEKTDLSHFPPVGDVNCAQTNVSSNRWRELEDENVPRLTSPWALKRLTSNNGILSAR
jgi:hypothetical protein